MNNKIYSDKCSLCDVILTKENNSKEHIIPNAIGGKRKISGFICKNCNNLYGQKWDNCLAEQLNYFCVSLDIKRDRGNAPDEIIKNVNGEEYRLKSSGVLEPRKTHFVEDVKDNVLNIKLMSPNKKVLQKNLKGLKRKYPHLEVDKIAEDAKVIKKYNDASFSHSFDFQGKLLKNSVLKTVFSFLKFNRVHEIYLNILKKYLLGSEKIGIACNFLYKKDIVKNREDNKIFHCVSIYGSSQDHKLLAYVEFFGFLRYGIILSEEYHGENVADTYAINPITGKEIDVRIDFQWHQDEINKIKSNEYYDFELLKDAITSFMFEIHKFQRDRELYRVMEEGMQKACKACGLNINDGIPYEIKDKYWKVFFAEIHPYIVHMAARKVKSSNE